MSVFVIVMKLNGRELAPAPEELSSDEEESEFSGIAA